MRKRSLYFFLQKQESKRLNKERPEPKGDGLKQVSPAALERISASETLSNERQL
jgi:hypothetical protein